jgi:hypothetical protein
VTDAALTRFPPAQGLVARNRCHRGKARIISLAGVATLGRLNNDAVVSRADHDVHRRTGWMLYETKARGVVPAALVPNAVNPIMAQGAAFADPP